MVPVPLPPPPTKIEHLYNAVPLWSQYNVHMHRLKAKNPLSSEELKSPNAVSSPFLDTDVAVLNSTIYIGRDFFCALGLSSCGNTSALGLGLKSLGDPQAFWKSSVQTTLVAFPFLGFWTVA